MGSWQRSKRANVVTNIHSARPCRADVVTAGVAIVLDVPCTITYGPLYFIQCYHFELKLRHHFARSRHENKDVALDGLGYSLRVQLQRRHSSKNVVTVQNGYDICAQYLK
ncbi:hypothetical protein Y032_0149g2697 [Ancylostoma ceylanicum]|uniref:Uncharacterized protein n=1 Tax=Ancylostoma ceylanicum TaxID=53326 RepID=A0A016T0T6_9BILA|nr:hypothetical protein Y032_0149g2697 [Ancylostoma ceylanicum]